MVIIVNNSKQELHVHVTVDDLHYHTKQPKMAAVKTLLYIQCVRHT
jgi:hypothetical protein